MAQINAYLTFNGNCREAMTFYKECLGAELSMMQTIGGSTIADKMPVEVHNNILHARLVKDGLVLLSGSDMVGPEGIVKGNAVTLSLDCGSEEEIHTLFSKLSSGGNVTYPVSVEFWGALFGTLTD